MLSILWEEVLMYTILITQEVQCESKDHAYGIWAGSDKEVFSL